MVTSEGSVMAPPRSDKPMKEGNSVRIFVSWEARGMSRNIHSVLLYAVGLQRREGSKIVLCGMPLGLSCGILCGHMIADPNAEEEALTSTNMTIVLDSDEKIAEVYAPGGQCISQQMIQDCIEAAKIRVREIRSLLNQVLGL